MYLTISNTTKFLNNVGDYIKTTYNIVPKDFVFDDIGDKYPIVYSNGRIENIVCPEKQLHLHNNINIYCSIPERVAITFIHNSIFGEKKEFIINAVREWLPEVTFDCVDVCFSNSVSKVCSNLFPSYVLKFLVSNLENKIFSYTYIDRGQEKKDLLYEKDYYIENCEKDLLTEFDFDNWSLFEYKVCELDKTIMVRARSRSRSRSRSASRNRSASPSSGGKIRKRRTSSKRMTRKSVKPRNSTKRSRRRSRSVSQ